MSIRGWLRKAPLIMIRFLRFIFEDKDFKGQNFSHLKVRNGMLYVDEESEAYENMLPKKYLAPRVDDSGCIVLPRDIRSNLKNTDDVEYWKVSEDMYVITVRKPAPISRAKKVEELLSKISKDSKVDGWH